MNAGMLREKIMFQVMDDNENWNDYIFKNGVKIIRAGLKGLKNSEYWVNMMGGNADEYVNISLRYNKEIIEFLPQLCRIVHIVGDKQYIYSIISPPEDVGFRHLEIRMRGRRFIC